MTNTSGLPERRPRPRAGIPDPGATNRLPTIGGDHSVDLERLRASASSAIAAEQADETESSSTPPSERPEPGSPEDRRTGSGRRDGDGATRTTPLWLKVALVAGLAIAAASLALALGGDDTTVATEDTSAAPTTDAPVTTDAPTTVVETTAVPETTAEATAAPTTAAPADPNAPPPHKATYRAGKLYLEGRISSAEEGQKYVEKAAAVLGPENVVNQYEIDPSVPLSNDGTVYVDEPFLFETGSAELNPAYTGVLGLGVAALKLNPAARMIVTGYTDSTGRPEKNQELSLARANAVVDYMVSTGGIDRARFDAIGAGDQNPVGDNATEEGRQLNRRIDVKLVDLLG